MYPNDPNVPRDGAGSGATPDGSTHETTPLHEALPTSAQPTTPVPDAGGADAETATPPAHIPGASMPGASTPGTSMQGASMPAASMPGASMPGASTPGASMPDAPMPGASTPGASMPGAPMPDADAAAGFGATGAGAGGGAGSVPPGAAGAAGAAAGAPRGGAFGRKGAWVAIVLTVIGGLVIAGTLGQSIWQSAVSWPRAVAAGPTWQGERGWDGPWNGGWNSDPMQEVFNESVAVDGVTAIDVEGRSSEYSVAYGDVGEAELVVESTSDRERDWTFEVSGTTLTVAELDSTSVQPWGGDRTRVTLTLPQALEASTPNLDVDMRSGAITVDGDFGDVVMGVQSGAVNFAGAATTVAVNVQSGAGNASVTGATSATLTVGSGVLHTELLGAQPQSITIDVESGLAAATVPAGAYAVSGDASSGVRDVQVSTDPAATSTLAVNVTSGAASVSQPGS